MFSMVLDMRDACTRSKRPAPTPWAPTRARELDTDGDIWTKRPLFQGDMFDFWKYRYKHNRSTSTKSTDPHEIF